MHPVYCTPVIYQQIITSVFISHYNRGESYLTDDINYSSLLLVFPLVNITKEQFAGSESDHYTSTIFHIGTRTKLAKPFLFAQKNRTSY
jgi:hypothetical protein